MAGNGTYTKTIGLVGSANGGKTRLSDMMLFKSGKTSRAGVTTEGSSIFDYEPEEQEKQHSIVTSVADTKWNSQSISIVDMPGFSDFYGEVISGIQAIETGIIVIPSDTALPFQAQKMWDWLIKANKGKIIVINHMDSDEANTENRLSEIKDNFGVQCIPFNYPTGSGSTFKGVVDTFNPPADIPDDVKDKVEEVSGSIIDSIVEADDDLMERYLDGQEISKEELSTTLTKGMLNNTVTPVLFCSATDGTGVEELLSFIANYAPSIADLPNIEGTNPETKEVIQRKPQENEPFSAKIFKIVRDDYIGKLSYAKVISGTLTPDYNPLLVKTGKTFRFAQMVKLFGAKQEPCEKALPGDIIALTKVENLEVSDTICAPKDIISYPNIEYPIPMSSLAVLPKTQADEKKLSTSIQRVVEEDPTFESSYDEQTKELVITGISLMHLETIIKKLKRRFGVSVNTKPPKIRYRETISKAVKLVEYTHKKQSGGAGQYGRVIIDIEPNERGAGYEFIDKIFGGAIDQGFRPSVNKGIIEKMKDGILAGYPVCDVKVYLVDGKTHPVDSKDIAFQIAGREAFKKGFMSANPILLEPIVNLEVTVPGQFFGDISGDISSRRGKVSGMEALGDLQIIKAEAPLAELTTYASDLRSITSGQGDFSMEFARYEPVPSRVQEDIIKQFKVSEEKNAS